MKKNDSGDARGGQSLNSRLYGRAGGGREKPDDTYRAARRGACALSRLLITGGGVVVDVDSPGRLNSSSPTRLSNCFLVGASVKEVWRMVTCVPLNESEYLGLSFPPGLQLLN